MAGQGSQVRVAGCLCFCVGVTKEGSVEFLTVVSVLLDCLDD